MLAISLPHHCRVEQLGDVGRNPAGGTASKRGQSFGTHRIHKSGWRAPNRGSFGDRLVKGGECDFLSDEFPTDLTEPWIGRGVVDDDLPKKYTVPALLRRGGSEQLHVGHPKYFALADGLPETVMNLREYVNSLQYMTSDNVTFVFERDALTSDGDDQGFWFPNLYDQIFLDDEVGDVFTLGGDGTGIGFHAHGATLLALMHGYKFWLVAPPGELPTALRDPVHGHGYRLLAKAESLPNRGKPHVMRCVQPPGSIIYLPDAWEHATVNLGAAVGRALQSEIRLRLAGAASETLLRNPDDVESLLTAGRWLSESVKAEVAMYDRATVSDPGDLRSYLFAANTLKEIGDVDGAVARLLAAREAALRNGAEADPPMPAFIAAKLVLIATELCELSRFVEGAPVLQEALALDPQSIAVHANGEMLKKCSRVESLGTVEVRTQDAGREVQGAVGGVWQGAEAVTGAGQSAEAVLKGGGQGFSAIAEGGGEERTQAAEVNNLEKGDKEHDEATYAQHSVTLDFHNTGDAELQLLTAPEYMGERFSAKVVLSPGKVYSMEVLNGSTAFWVRPLSSWGGKLFIADGSGAVRCRLVESNARCNFDAMVAGYTHRRRLWEGRQGDYAGGSLKDEL